MSRFTWPLIILLCIGCVFLPITHIYGTSFLYNEKRIFAIGILALSAIIFAFFPRKMFAFSSRKISNNYIFGAALIFFLSIFSAVLSSFPFYAFTEISLFITMIVLVGCIGVITKDDESIVYIIFGTVCIFALLYSIKFSIQYYFHISGHVSFWLWPGGVASRQLVGFSNIRFFNQVQAFTLPLLVGSAVIVLSKKKWAGYTLLLLPVIWWMLLIQSAGRGVILSVLTAGLLVLLLFKENTHQWSWYFLGTLAVGYIAKIVLFEIIPDPEQVKSIVRGGSGRLTLWPRLFLDTLNRPILGHGPMSFANINTSYFRGHPHNSVLQLLYEFGYPITITIIGGIFYGIKKWVGQTNNLLQRVGDTFNQDTIIRISLTAALLGGLLYSLFSGVIVMPLSQLWLAIIAGTIFGLYIGKSETEDLQPLKKWKIYATKFVVLLAAGILLAVVMKDVPDFQENKKKYIKEASSAKLRPRLWQQGKIGLDEFDPQEKISNR